MNIFLVAKERITGMATNIPQLGPLGNIFVGPSEKRRILRKYL
jgi:hypothetical protein